MTDAASQILLSVRGEAQRTVAPDQVSIHWSVSAWGESKTSAISALTGQLDEVGEGLSQLHGAVLTADTTRAPLTWSTQSVHTEREYSHNKTTGEHGPTGRHHAMANSIVVARDFTLLDRVEAVLTKHDSTDLHSYVWSVDHDNAEWSLVRADAIQAALLKGRDYALALDGELVSVDHIADAGLLGTETRAMWQEARAAARSTSAVGTAGGSTNPVPQVLGAVIEARLTARIAPLT